MLQEWLIHWFYCILIGQKNKIVIDQEFEKEKMSGWDDEEWKPPSAEQLAEIEKRRARKDYICCIIIWSLENST